MILRFLVLICICLSCSGVLPAQRTLVFIGAFNRDKNKAGIQVLQLDTSNGLLRPLSVLKGILNPSYFSLSADGRFLYACTETQTAGMGGVTAFRVDTARGALVLLNRQQSSGENPVYTTLSENGKYLFSVNYTGAGMDVFPVADDGRIAPVVQSIAYDKGSGATARQNKAHPHSACLTPGQDYIFIPDLGSDLIRSYRLDLDAQQPIQELTQAGINATPGSGPRHFTFHPNGQYAYCIGEISGTVAVYRYAAGQLKRLQHIATHQHSLEAYNSADIHMAPDGRFLYVSNRGNENNIAIFAVQKNGRLRSIGYQATLGEHPRIFAIDTAGKFLIVANQISGNVVVFKRDQQSGLLCPVPQDVRMENASCVQIKQYGR